MTFFLLDYEDNKEDIFLQKEVDKIKIEVVSGDEIATVYYSNGDEEVFDAGIMSGNWRTTDYLDGEYVAYENGEWIYGFKERSSSYWR